MLLTPVNFSLYNVTKSLIHKNYRKNVKSLIFVIQLFQMFYKHHIYNMIFVILYIAKLEEKVTFLAVTNSVTEQDAIAPIEDISFAKVFGWVSISNEVIIISFLCHQKYDKRKWLALTVWFFLSKTGMETEVIKRYPVNRLPVFCFSYKSKCMH